MTSAGKHVTGDLTSAGEYITGYKRRKFKFLTCLFAVVFRGDAQAKMGKVTNTKGSFQKKLAEMKKKIKQTNQDANACDTGELSVFSVR